ncbi:MAG: hydroxymethylglutaryl-CoA synthase family protein, partial [Clostridia bacterium]|nr:hydroxymethylglutaryl-CoA synthase family protein [Deltaproteobacteria bacterium]
TAAQRLITRYDVDKNRIGMLVVGTETGVDHSKAVASFVQGLLELPRTMRTFDTQHACYGGTAALMAAADWIMSGASRGKAALVVCSDIARYGLNTAGEPTQGAGSVAMLISNTPHLFELDHGISGTDASHVFDFWRPIGRREAVVDGQYSISCYLDAVNGAYASYREVALQSEILRKSEYSLSEQFARISYHVPFCKMAKKAHLHLRKQELAWMKGRALTAEESAAEDKAGAASFEKQVAPSLGLASRIGNTYTSSMYLGLATLLQTQGKELAGKRIGMFSYGSGNSSEFYSGIIGEEAAANVAKAQLENVLEGRRRIDMTEYEAVMNMPYDAPPDVKPRTGTFRFTGMQDHRRCYAEG